MSVEVKEKNRFIAGRIIRKIFNEHGQDYDDMRRGSWFYLELPDYITSLVQQGAIDDAENYLRELF